jgi:hypothetical protein
MRRERVQPPKPQGAESAVDNLLWLAVGTVLAATVLVWLVGQVAVVLFGTHHWLRISLAQVTQVPFHLTKHSGDPKLAWPTSVRRMLPGPVGMYAALALILAVPAALAGAVLGRRLRWDQRLQRHGTQWAGRWRLRRLIVLAPRPGRITLGRRGGWFGRLLLAVESCHSVRCRACRRRHGHKRMDLLDRRYHRGSTQAGRAPGTSRRRPDLNCYHAGSPGTDIVSQPPNMAKTPRGGGVWDDVRGSH